MPVLAQKGTFTEHDVAPDQIEETKAWQLFWGHQHLLTFVVQGDLFTFYNKVADI